ncbi:sister chromatid cohesion 1 protein 1 [Cryptomeria japonica]|uniref:sister chromatid cohesion 1 protein 1 n=1 Tax=Cryptomeria japonica TaxID=3369 RepID=UPI0027D9D300|nr:sister chromatid cohesion 1 protein 1 [Cryptomeria japonica]
MFYSHQLLSRKVPLGQIWIAATMHTKINRRNVDRIDIVEICEQILNPAVPLALRLSGILMGGVVIIYNKKVKFLYDDATRFMIQIKKDITKSRVPGADTTVLPKGRSQAKFENITISYALDELDDIEQLMAHPKERHQISLEEFCLIPGEEPNASLKPMKFQADVENITLRDDNFRFEQRYRDKTQMFDEDRLVGEPENNTLPPELNLNTEQQQDGEIPKEPDGFNTNELPHEVEHQGEAQREGPKSPEPDAQSIQPPIRRTNRQVINRKRKKNSIILDEDFTVIPPRVYQEWLNDPSDLVKDDTCRLKIKKERARNRNSTTAEKLMRLPSTLFFSMSGKLSSDPCCAMPLLELWNQNILAQNKGKIQETLGTRTTRSSLAAEMRNDEEQPINFGETELVNEARETLRANLATQNLPKDLDFNTMRLTPMPSGQSTKSNKVTPASGPLGSINEGSTPRINRPKSKHITPDGFGNVLPDEEQMMEEFAFASPRWEVGSGQNQNINPSQFDLMVETEPSQPILNQTPKESMDHLTGKILDHFRDHFKTPGVPPKQSLNQLTEGMKRRQAARLFYQTCVLATHKYVKVEQEEAYGDIMIQRGPSL